MKKINHPEYIFLIVGLILVMGAPYLPDVFFDIIQQDTLYADRYFAARIDELIPSLRLGGVLLFVWGMITWLKKAFDTTGGSQ